MKIDAWQCDCCGKQYKKEEGYTWSPVVGVDINSTGYTESISDSVDLCNSCFKKTFEMLTHRFLTQFKQRINLIEMIRQGLILKYKVGENGQALWESEENGK